MEQYFKINTIYKRTEKGELMLGEYSTPEIEYLAANLWIATEKIDGTNVRVMWEGGAIRFGGKTDNAQMPTFLYDRLVELFPPEKMAVPFGDGPVCLYGEGYGAKIQKGGGNYIPDGVDFILFEVKIGHWWLKWEDVVEIAGRLGIKHVPCLGRFTPREAADEVHRGIWSCIADREAEGMVLRPDVRLLDGAGRPIRAKIKTKDFARIAE